MCVYEECRASIWDCPSSQMFHVKSLPADTHTSLLYISHFYKLTSNSCNLAILFLSTPNIFDTKIHPIAISDHAPVSLTLKIESSFTPFIWWRFNTSPLKDSHFDRFIREEWSSFLEMNSSPNTSPTLLRETGKAVIRRKIISNSRKTRAKSTKQLREQN